MYVRERIRKRFIDKKTGRFCIDYLNAQLYNPIGYARAAIWERRSSTQAILKGMTLDEYYQHQRLTQAYTYQR